MTVAAVPASVVHRQQRDRAGGRYPRCALEATGDRGRGGGARSGRPDPGANPDPSPLTAAEGFFTLLQGNPLLGRPNLDLLIMVNAVLMFPILLAVYLTLRRAGETAMLLALTLEIVANALSFVWNASFTMLARSGQHAEAASAAERATVLAAGQAALTTHLSGTAFGVSYILGAVDFLLIGVTMLRSAIFGKLVASMAIAGGALRLVPPTVGPIGLSLSLRILVPMSLWFVLIARIFRTLDTDGEVDVAWYGHQESVAPGGECRHKIAGFPTSPSVSISLIVFNADRHQY